MDNLKAIAILNADLWEYHDRRDFHKLNLSANKLLLRLGYKKESKNVGKHITNAYKFHADVDDKLSNIKNWKKYKLEIEQYRIDICREMGHSFALIGVRDYNKIAFYHSKWWINFMICNITRNKLYYIPILYYLFMEQYIKLQNPIYGIIATYRLYTAAAKGHNKRDHNNLVKELIKYWDFILRVDKRPLMF